MQPDLHPGGGRGTRWKHEMRDETEGTSRCMQQEGDGEVSCGGACVGESLPDGRRPQRWTMAEDRSCW